MGWFDDMKAKVATKYSQISNAGARDRVLATAALIVAADGKVEAAERAKVVKLVANSDALKAFDAGECGRKFEEYLGKAEDDFGRLDLLNLVRKAGAAEGDTLLRVAIVLANADGDFADCEKKVVRELAGVLGLKPGDYLGDAAAA